ncbi:hypothetical protein [Halococcus saccharolyticus]|uniref:Uncharacterized protein n=1 Tax=Halococcus saccharolyticus DSM 5350 TaxID=1227455 RepID=M0MS98_9EURY|nr:hypothetical protein [Halococcus saccharolyticus]EMA47614.1 hypothetical protein C449_01087 [Halococcus saccharolyticus DSM 5350]
MNNTTDAPEQQWVESGVEYDETRYDPDSPTGPCLVCGSEFQPLGDPAEGDDLLWKCPGCDVVVAHP